MNTTSHNKGRKFPPQPLTGDEVVALMDACSKRAPSGRRDKALICVLWRAQLRVSEALDLRPSDFDAKQCTVRVREGKGRKSRVAIIDKQAADVLVAWLEVRKGLGRTGREPIFCTLRGGKMSSAQLREKLPRLAKRAGIDKRVHPHGLRHTGASELCEEGVSLVDISAQLGHSSVSTTNSYLHAINPKARAERLRSREW